MTPSRLKTAFAGLALIVSVSLIVLGGATGASATTDPINAGTGQGGDSTIYYTTPRTFTHSHNNASFEITNPGSDYNPSFVFALRPGTAHTGTYARTGSFTSGSGFHYAATSSGSTTLGSGTFYLSTSIDGCMGPVGDCYGATAGFGVWSGYITYIAAP